MADKNIAKTLGEVSNHFGRSLHSIKVWRAKGMPGKKGHYDLDEIETWRANTFRRGHDDDKPGTKAENALRSKLLEAELRKKAADADVAERKRDEFLDKTLVAITDVETFLSELFTDHRRRMLRMPEALKGSFPAEFREEIAEVIRDRVILELRHTWNYCRRLADLADDSSN